MLEAIMNFLGDTLTAIAKKYNTTVAVLVELNDITDPDYIVVGQVLVVSGFSLPSHETAMSEVKFKAFGLQSNTDRTVYATWHWDREHTEHYRVIWYYNTGDKVWFVGSDSTTTNKQATYNAPTNAEGIKLRVRPISTKHRVNDKDTSDWTANWSENKYYSFSDNPPKTPPKPSV